MNKKIALLIATVLLTFIIQPVFALEIVIDPGHDGNQQNRGGPAFTVDEIGNTLPMQEFEGQWQIEVFNADVFSNDTEPHNYSIIRLGTDTYTVQNVDYNNNVLTLSDTLTQDYPAGTEVTVNDFLVQAMGQKDTGNSGDWGAADTDYTELSYTHEISASEWDQWKRKENTDGVALGLLELVNTWRISQKLEEILNDTHAVVMTKENMMDNVSAKNRGQAGDTPDIFVSIHTNSGLGIGVTNVKGTEYVPYKTKPYVESFDNSLVEPSKVWSPSHKFEVQWYTDESADTPVPTFSAI